MQSVHALGPGQLAKMAWPLAAGYFRKALERFLGEIAQKHYYSIIFPQV